VGVAAIAVAMSLCPLAVRGAAQQILRGGIDLVVVDMRVLSKHKQVTDLRPDEVTLLVDGKPRPIASLEYVPARRGAPTRARSTSNAVPSVDAPSNRLVILVDRDSLAPSDRQPVRESLQRFIERLPQDDFIAVTTLPLSESVRFERDREAVSRALDAAFTGAFQRTLGMEAMSGFGCDTPGSPKDCGGDLPVGGNDLAQAKAKNIAAEMERQQSDVLRDLRWLFTVLASTNGPTDVVIVNGGLPHLDRMRVELERVVGTARLGRVRVHTLRIANLTQVVPASDPSAEADLEGTRLPPAVLAPAKSYDLAARTGGLEEDRAVSSKDFFKYLEQELAGSYVLAFEPLPLEHDGRAHTIDIKIARSPRPTVHARKEFVVGATSYQSSSGPTASSGPQGSGGLSDSSAASPGSDAPSTTGLRDLIARAVTYVDRFERTFSTVVAEERYVQVVKPWTGGPPLPGDEPALAWRKGTDRQIENRDTSVLRRRQLLSDLLLVQPPGQTWIAYRDVAEVDGKAVRDRAVRIQQLFLSNRSEDQEQLQRIAKESARHNLGSYRNINTPTFPLMVLRQSNVGRFRLIQYPDEPHDATCCAVIGFSEVARPTIVHTGKGRDVPMNGQLWIEPTTGRVRRATLAFAEDRELVRGTFDVRFRADPSLDVLIPDRMWEWYMSENPDDPGRQAYIEGQASYENIRRFTVSTDEQVK